MTLPEQIERIVRDWPQWSRAERQRLDAITWEVTEFMSDGVGNRFIAEWCRRVLIPQLGGADRAQAHQS